MGPSRPLVPLGAALRVLFLVLVVVGALVTLELEVATSQQHATAFAARGANFDASVSRARGVVLSLHDEIFPLGLSLIRELRCLGNSELIQVYHCHELSPRVQERLVWFDNRLEIIDVCEALQNVTLTMPAKPFQDKSGRFVRLRVGAKEDKPLSELFHNWWLKPLSLYHTDLEEVLLLDADDLLLQDPASLCESHGYTQNGTLFFYDRAFRCRQFLNATSWKTDRKPYIRHILERFDYERFGIERPTEPSQRLKASLSFRGTSCHEQDSSLMAVDKRCAGKALDVLWWLITEERFRVDFSWGDKGSFWLAYELARESYAFSPWGVSVVSSSASEDVKKHPDTLCGSIAQYVPSPNGTEPELLYVNGKALIQPFPEGFDNRKAQANIRHNQNLTRVSPRRERVEIADSSFPMECLVGAGSTKLDADFGRKLIRRRALHSAASLLVESTLKMQCDVF